MRKLLTAVALLVSVASSATPWEGFVDLTVRARVREPASHPRLLAGAQDFVRLRNATNELVRAGRDRVIFEADQMRRFPLPMYRLEGRRLLTVSQRVLARIAALSMAYRLTDDPRYAKRAIQEAETVCSFKDWNPKHFLDTAEMTLAVAIAYDWLYDAMTPEQRTSIRGGLIRNGLCEKDGSPKTGGWATAANNWGQVCHAGLAAGAIAVMEDEPELAERILSRSVKALPRPMQAFAPEGGFSEGPGFYWGYAMTFNVLAIDAVERVCGTDFGLCRQSGFRESVDYLDSVTGPTGLKFNYSDAGISPRQDLLARRSTEACSWWLARRFNRPDTLVRFEIPAYRAYCAERAPMNPTPRRSFQRLFPFTLLWMQPPADDVHETKTPLYRLIQGETPLAIQRTGWAPTDWFFALKGGSPQTPHGHMDVGSFVLDAKGCRWASDLGSEDYHRMESEGRNIWGRAQNSDRWKIFRLGPASHNILRVNDGVPYAGGRATFITSTNAPLDKVALDLTRLYPGAVSAVRTGTLLPAGGYILNDHISGFVRGTVVKWQMLTPARVKAIEGNSILLAQKDSEGEETTLRLTTADRYVRWEARDVSAAQHPDESPNPGMTQISFSVVAPIRGDIDITIRFE